MRLAPRYLKLESKVGIQDSGFTCRYTVEQQMVRGEDPCVDPRPAMRGKKNI